MKITIEIPDATFQIYKKSAELIQKNYPFINPAQATAARLFEILLVADLPEADKVKPATVAKKCIKAVQRTQKIDLNDPEEDEVDQILKDNPAVLAGNK